MPLVIDVPASKQIGQPPVPPPRPLENAAPNASSMATKRSASQMNMGAPHYPPAPAPHAHAHHHHHHAQHAAAEAAKRQRLDLVDIPASCQAKIQVTSAQAGIVIGQKGSTIQQIRALSGARVNIDSHDEAQAKADPTRRDIREMTCVGTIEQVEAALNLLRQCFQTDNLIASAGKGAASNKAPHHQPAPPPRAAIAESNHFANLAANRQQVPPPSPYGVPPPHATGSPGMNSRPY